jgi:hypothetical protein
MNRNKYLDDDSISTKSDDDDDDISEDIDIHEIVRNGNYEEVKEAIAKDRPRLVCLKDKVLYKSLNNFIHISFLFCFLFLYLV